MSPAKTNVKTKRKYFDEMDIFEERLTELVVHIHHDPIFKLSSSTLPVNLLGAFSSV